MQTIIIDAQAFQNNVIPRMLIKAIWKSQKKKLELSSSKPIKINTYKFTFAETFNIEKSKFYFTVSLVNKETKQREIISSYDTNNRKIKIIDKTNFAQGTIPNDFIQAIWESHEQQLEFLSNDTIPCGNDNFLFTEDFCVQKSKYQVYFTVYHGDESGTEALPLASYNSLGQKISDPSKRPIISLNELPGLEDIDFSQPNSLSKSQISLLLKLLKHSNQQKITLSTEPDALIVNQDLYHVYSDEPVKLIRQRLRAAPKTAIFKVIHNGQVTQAYKIDKEKRTKTALNIVHVDLANLDEDANRECFLTAIKKRYKHANLANGKTKIIQSSLGIHYHNCLLVTTPYDVIPVINSKNQLRYKIVEHQAFGEGSYIKVRDNSFSFNPNENKMKIKPKVLKISKTKEKKPIESLKQDYEISRLFPQETYKAKYLLQLPDGRWITDQKRFDMSLEDYLDKILFSESINDTQRLELQTILALSFLEALAKAHNVIVHRDLKPENIFINIVNGIPEVYLGDFGLSVPQANKHDKKYPGTPNYAAPEIFTQGVDEVTDPQDMYSAAVIIATIFGATHPEIYFEGLYLDQKFLNKKYNYFKSNKQNIEDSMPQNFNLLPLLSSMGGKDWAKRPTAQEALDEFKSLCNLNGSCDNVLPQTNKANMLSP